MNEKNDVRSMDETSHERFGENIMDEHKND